MIGIFNPLDVPGFLDGSTIGKHGKCRNRKACDRKAGYRTTEKRAERLRQKKARRANRVK